MTSTAGPVSEGTITYTVLQGSTVIGTAVSVGVSSGTAPASYTIPGGTAGGSYTIQATYNAPNFQSTTNSTQRLTISAALAGTATTSTSIAYNGAVQPVALSATVSSAAGVVNEGFETFTIFTATNSQVGTSVTVPVVNGVANANYPLPAGAVGGTDKIAATFNGTANYQLATDSTRQLTITGAPAVTTATPTTTTFSGVAGTTVPVSATVTSPDGIVNEGNETFTILLGTTQIGSPVTVNVINGLASTGYLIPLGTVGGTYIIKAVYNGTSNFNSIVDTSQQLVISGSTTVSVASSAVTTFNGTAGQSVPLERIVTSASSPTGKVNEGTETFGVYLGTVLIGSPVTVNVVNGVANGVYIIPIGTAGGIYVVHAQFNGTVNFASSIDISQSITINAVVASTTAISTSTTFVSGGELVPLSANISSAFGTVNEGTETFTILLGTTQIGSPVTVNVVNGAATGAYSLPVNTAAGIYIIKAAYNGTANFQSFTDVTHSLTINAAVSVTVATSASVNFVQTTQVVALTASVTSVSGIP